MVLEVEDSYRGAGANKRKGHRQETRGENTVEADPAKQLSLWVSTLSTEFSEER